MGLDFIRDKKESFDQQTDDCLNRELDLDLVTGAYEDQDSQLIQCELIDESASVSPGGYRMILRIHSEQEATLLQAGKAIGKVTSEDLPRLVSLAKMNKIHTGIISVMATDEPDILGEFHVRPLKPFKNT